MKQATEPVAWSPDGKLLAAQGPENTLQLWQSNGKFHLRFTDYKAVIASLAWSPDGKRLASTAEGEKRLLIWDAAKGERDRELGPFAGTAQNVKWSADGRLLTFNVPEVGWHIWDIEKGQLVNDPAKWKVFWLNLTSDGRSALVAPSEKDVYRLCDLATAGEGKQLPHGHGMFQSHPTWSPDGRMLAVSFGGGIELWQPDLSKRLRTLLLPGGASGIAFSRDGKRIAAQNSERLLFWETDTGRPCGVMALGRRFNHLTISPDGHYNGNENVDSCIVIVVEKDDGSQENLEPAEFQRKYKWKNDPKQVRLTVE